MLRISYYLAAFLPLFHRKQVHFEGFWLKRAAISWEIGSGDEKSDKKSDEKSEEKSKKQSKGEKSDEGESGMQVILNVKMKILQ